MKLLTESEHADLIAARQELLELRSLIGANDLWSLTAFLLRQAHDRDAVVTIEQRSTQPYAMGRYENFVTIREKRGVA